MRDRHLNQMLSEIEAGYWGEIHSLLIAGHHKTWLEKYFGGHKRDNLHEMQSVTKSIQSLLLGMAIDKGYIKNMDEKIYPFLPEYRELFKEKYKKEITLRHLLTMTSGLQWDESNIPYAQLEQNDSNRMALSSDWIRFALNRPVLFPPGEHFNYSSAAPVILSKILKKATGISNEDFALKHLFLPLEIHLHHFQSDLYHPDVLGDIYLLPSDALKIGQLTLNRGKWGNKTLVSEKWIKTSLQPYIKTAGNHSGYGFFWWYSEFNFDGNLQPCTYAWGYGGQHIFVFFGLGIVVVCTGGMYQKNFSDQPRQLIEKYLLKLIS